MKKRVLSLLLVLVMVLAILPVPEVAAAEGATLTVSGNSYRNKYVVITDGTSKATYYITNNGTVQNMDGSAATFGAGSYTVYYGPLGMQKNRSFYKGSVTVDDSDSSASVSMSRTSWTGASSAEQYYFAESIY